MRLLKGFTAIHVYVQAHAMKPAVTCLLLMLTFSILSARRQASIKAATQEPEKPKLAKLIVVNGAGIAAKGIWRPDNPTKKNEVVEGVVELSCFRHGGKNLVGTEAFCLQATANILNSTDGLVDVNTEWLKVIEWSGSEIIATDDSAICVTSQTVFDLQRKTVIALDVRKSEARGLFDSCKLLLDRQTYYLQDVADYYGKKWANTVEKPQQK